MLSHRDGFTHLETLFSHTRTRTHTHTHTLLITQSCFYSEQLYTQMPLQTEVFYKETDLHEEFLYTDVFT